MMKSKGEWFEKFKQFQTFVEMQSKHKAIEGIAVDERRGLHVEEF